MIKIIFLNHGFSDQFLRGFVDVTAKFSRNIIEENGVLKGIIMSRKKDFYFKFFIVPLLNLDDIRPICKQLGVRFNPHSVVTVGEKVEGLSKRYHFHPSFGWMYFPKKSEIFGRSEINQFITTFIVNYSEELKKGQLRYVKMKSII